MPNANDWAVYVVQTTSGQVVWELPFDAAPQYSYKVNDAGAGSVSVPLGGNGIAASDLDQLTQPWRWSLAVCYRSYVVQAGPIVGEQWQDTGGHTTVSFVGLWKLFSKRLLLPPTWTGGTSPAVTGADTTYSNMTYRSMAIQMVQDSVNRQYGSLPVVLPAQDAASGTSQTYHGYDMNRVDDKLTDIVSMQGGPEIEFRPQFTDNTHSAIQWQMRVGTPRLGQIGSSWVWDYGDRGACSHLDYTRDGQSMTFSNYTRGSGSEYNLTVGAFQDTTLMGAGYPLLEDVNGNNTQETSAANLGSYAQAWVNTYKYPVVTYSARVRVDAVDASGRLTGSPTLDEFAVGDTCVVQVQNHRRIPDGSYTMRIVSVQQADAYSAQLGMQPTSGVY